MRKTLKTEAKRPSAELPPWQLSGMPLVAEGLKFYGHSPQPLGTSSIAFEDAYKRKTRVIVEREDDVEVTVLPEILNELGFVLGMHHWAKGGEVDGGWECVIEGFRARADTWGEAVIRALLIKEAAGPSRW